MTMPIYLAPFAAAPLAELTSRPFRETSRSRWYPGYARGAPDLLVIELPEAIRRPVGNPSGQTFKVVFSENGSDRRLAEEMMDLPLKVDPSGAIDMRLTIDRVSRRPSSAPTSRNLLILHFLSPEEGWPHYIVTKLPSQAPGQGFGRERYAYETFMDRESAEAHVAKLERQHVTHMRAMGLKLPFNFMVPRDPPT